MIQACVLPCRHLAAAEGCYSVVEWLLTEGKCAPNPIDRFKRTPLEVFTTGLTAEVSKAVYRTRTLWPGRDLVMPSNWTSCEPCHLSLLCAGCLADLRC